MILTQVREDLEAPWAALQDAARRVAKTSNDSKLVVDVPQYVASFRPELMEIVSAWARGARFADLLRTTDIFEVTFCDWTSQQLLLAVTITSVFHEFRKRLGY